MPLFSRQLSQRHNGAKPRAIDHDIEGTERVARGTHGTLDLTLIRNVRYAANRTLTQLARGGFECLGANVAEQNARTCFYKRGGDRFADTGCGAGHDRAFSHQLMLHVQLRPEMPVMAGRLACWARAHKETTGWAAWWEH